MFPSVIVHVIKDQEGLFSFSAARTLPAVRLDHFLAEPSVPVAAIGVPALAVRLPVGPDLFTAGGVVLALSRASTFLAAMLQAVREPLVLMKF